MFQFLLKDRKKTGQSTTGGDENTWKWIIATKTQY